MRKVRGCLKRSFACCAIGVLLLLCCLSRSLVFCDTGPLPRQLLPRPVPATPLCARHIFLLHLAHAVGGTLRRASSLGGATARATPPLDLGEVLTMRSLPKEAWTPLCGHSASTSSLFCSLFASFCLMFCSLSTFSPVLRFCSLYNLLTLSSIFAHF